MEGGGVGVGLPGLPVTGGEGRGLGRFPGGACYTSRAVKEENCTI
jgi:hypothetical protein